MRQLHRLIAWPTATIAAVAVSVLPAPLEPQAPQHRRDPAADSEPTTRRDFEALLSRQWRVAQAHPDSATLWLEVGRTKLAMWRAGFVAKETPYQRLGVSFLESAVEALERAAALEHDGAAATALAELVLDPDLRRYGWLRRSVDSLAASLARQGESGGRRLDLVRGLLEQAQGDLVAADSAFASYLRRGGDRPRALLELARVRLTLAWAGADSLYFEAAASDDRATVAGLRADLALIADSTELAHFDASQGAERADFLRRFWEARDLADLRRPGERLREHYRRIEVARRRYRLRQWPRRYETYELYRPKDSEFDDRGVIYIRHGEPDDSATVVAIDACPNVSWVYRRPGASLVFHFVARTDLEDFRIVETLDNVGNGNGATNRLRRFVRPQSFLPDWAPRTVWIGLECGPIPDTNLALSRIRIDPIYAKLAVRPSRRNWEAELALTTRSRLVGTTTDSYALRYPVVLTPVVQAYALAGPGTRRGRFLVVYAVPRDQLRPDTTASGAPYRLALRALATTPALESFERDTVHVARSRAPLAPGQYLTGLLELPVPSDTLRLGVVLEDAVGDAGQFVTFDSVVVPSSDGPGPSLSDVVLGREGSGLDWLTSVGPFPLNPLNTYRPDGLVELYYEVYGLRAGASYETTISTTLQGDRRQRPRVQLRFEAQAADGIEHVRRTVGLRDLEPGTYWLTIEVASGGLRATRRQLIHVVKR